VTVLRGIGGVTRVYMCATCRRGAERRGVGRCACARCGCPTWWDPCSCDGCGVSPQSDDSAPGASGTAELTGPECSPARRPGSPVGPSPGSHPPRRKRPRRFNPRPAAPPSRPPARPRFPVPGEPDDSARPWLGEVHKAFESRPRRRGDSLRITRPRCPQDVGLGGVPRRPHLCLQSPGHPHGFLSDSHASEIDSTSPCHQGG
jgi:hypothetical protein